jgi:hypothetical protein
VAEEQTAVIAAALLHASTADVVAAALALATTAAVGTAVAAALAPIAGVAAAVTTWAAAVSLLLQLGLPASHFRC